MKLTTFVIPALLLLGSCADKTAFACGTPSAPVIIPIPEDIYFAYNSAALTLESIDQLRTNSRWYVMHNQHVLIEGHCDERGSKRYNNVLGQARADIAKEYMVDIGVDPTIISTVSIGKANPASSEHHEVAWAQNRRDHFVAQ